MEHHETPLPAEPVDNTEKKVVQSISTREKVCATVSILAIMLAILNATGLIAGLPEFLDVALKVHPASVFFFTGILTVVVTMLLVCLTPRRFEVLAYLPAAIFAAFWLNRGWIYVIEKSAVLTSSNVGFIHLATMALGFCLAYHATVYGGKKPTLSQRWLIFIVCALFINFLAFCITTGLAGFADGVASQVAFEQRQQEIITLMEGATREK
jgi:hypothetical protein